MPFPKCLLFESQDQSGIIVKVGRDPQGSTSLSGKVCGYVTLSGGFQWCLCLGWHFLLGNFESAKVVGPWPSLQCSREGADIAGRNVSNDGISQCH